MEPHCSMEDEEQGRLAFRGMPTFMLIETLTLMEGNMLAGVWPCEGPCVIWSE
jgi:hypothetical protein